VRHQNPSPWRQLGNRTADLARAVAGLTADVIAHGSRPPAAVIIAERSLWRFADELRRTRQPATGGRYVTAVLLVELDRPRDPGWLGEAIVATAGPQGDGWTIRHTSVSRDYQAPFAAAAGQPGGEPR